MMSLLGFDWLKLAGIAVAVIGFFSWRWNDKRKLRQEGAVARETALKEGWDKHAQDVDRAVQDARAGGADAARERLRRAAGGDSAGDGGALLKPWPRPPDPR